ncbi:phosphoglycolate phosphatase [Hydrogenophaga crassostreae]|uniref:phosphoglycolate phosphatase n=1 Tax=Hydrogenophaga crassostreae TaxID=1763535 RepID=A0A167IKG9_9BURK|nr:HAD-IA family hydrolase [Hydrogenophaga crassostreae]AOW14504.1 phosphoglycolate phosphatase [Hydrogenophaga crassostreae]OAD43086.1 phosphoglycolate phosphatase [Hydrogenophaga crassostreae]
MSLPYDLILFDLDGTLIETAPEIADAVNDTLSECGRPGVSQQQVNDWIGHGTRELLIQALAFTDELSAHEVRHSNSFAAIEAVFTRHYQRRCGTRSHLYPHVSETLEALRAAGVKLVVMTNKEGRYTQTVLEAHRMAPLFDRVISGDTFPVKKPSPIGIEACLKQFATARERALFVGDSSIDVATARAGGIAVWAVPYGYNMGEPIEACQPDRVIPDFSVLTRLLTG